MENKKITFIGENNVNAYSVDCTGDICVGDEIMFERAVFTGSYRKPRFSHNERLFLKVLKDSYGAKKQQHTFTCLNVITMEKILIKGRNVYRNGTYRKLWKNEEERVEVLIEKHARGEMARRDRFLRRIQV